MERVEEGLLVNTITSGQFAGGTITFDIQPDGADRSTVEARLAAELSGLGVLAAPLLRRSVRRAFARALEEDRHDLESGSYAGRPSGSRNGDGTRSPTKSVGAVLAVAEDQPS